MFGLYDAAFLTSTKPYLYLKMNILILGNPEDAHALHLHNSLTQAGATVNYLDTQMFPTQLKMSWQPNSQVGYLILPSGIKLDIQDIHSVFWRSFSGVNIPSLEDTNQEMIIYNDSMSMLRTIIKACPSHWVNSWSAYEFHKEKPLQLSQVNQIGVSIPKTLISNDPQQVTEFALANEKVIFKPVYGGAHTQFVTSAHLEPKRLGLALSLSPVTIQEYIPGTNIRSYVIADTVYSAEIRTPSLDFREDLEAELIPLELPEFVQQQCIAIARSLMLEWTAIDWRLNLSGEYVFLEANPSPMFLYFEERTGFPITQQLVKLLIS